MARPPSKHVLSEIDPEARTAVCAYCGPVRVRVRQRGRGRPTGWECGVAANRRSRPRRSRWLKDACERCGFDDPRALVIHHRDRDRSNDAEENCETVCANCHAIEHATRSRVRS